MKLALLKKNNKLREIYYEDEIKFDKGEDFFLVNDISKKQYFVGNTLSVGRGKDKDIESNSHNVLVDFEKKLILTDKNIFHNFEEKIGKIEFNYGDNIIVGLLMKIEFISPSLIQITNYGSKNKINLLDGSRMIRDYPEFPIYTSSPRYIKYVEEEVYEIEQPPEKEKKNTMGTLARRLVPLFVSVGLGVFVAIVQPRGIRGVVMVVGSIFTALLTLITLIIDRARDREFNRKREDVYQKYLMEKREELREASINELDTKNYNDLSQIDILAEIKTNSPRLYEREIMEEGFLNLRIGVGDDKPKFKIKLAENRLKIEKEELEEEMEQVYHDYKIIDNIPYTANLYRNNIGLIGEEDVIVKQLHNLLMQIVFSHSYHDVKLIFITNEEEYEQLSYFKWLKHAQNGDTGLNTFINDDVTRDQMLSSYVQILRQRNDSQKKEEVNLPHFVFVITNYQLIKNHAIMEFLLKDHKGLGFSLLMAGKQADFLPKNIDTVIEYENVYQANVLTENNRIINHPVVLEKFNDNLETLEEATRKIGQLEHIKGIKSSIPDQLGFLEMFDVKNIEELNIPSRWTQNRSYASLGVVIGKKTKTDYVELNLHEKAHGPHGLIAGTTGSGKSEVIQTYILSLALNYSPEEIGFLLIDYKGGGMANLFKDMPHHLGSITNLDGYQSLRALASIKSELKRRQKIFSENDVNHINGYHKLYEKNEVEEALPHLFLISDEFAELKTEQPEFMKELVSAARIGRSLGIHLILATQKPSGVVDDQIWSNSKFKLSLKVAEEADSKELLKTADAAYIKNPGRGYLKVGNDELYELFQSGYSGAPYEQNSSENIDLRIYKINENGSKEVINSGNVNFEEKKEESEITELTAVLDEISDVYSSFNYQEIRRPWMPPLEDVIEMDKEIKDLTAPQIDMEVPYALVDLPNSQDQVELKHNFMEDGHIAIFGSSGQGKSSTMLTLALGLAKQTSPEFLKYFILDFGNNALIQLRELNHTANYVKNGDELRFQRLLKYLQREITSRRQKLEEKKANSFKTYNNMSGSKMESIVIFLDNFDSTKEMDRELIDQLALIMREGVSLGIYFVVSFTGSRSARESIFNLFNQKVVLFTNDPGDLTSLVGRSDYPQQEIPGRMQVKLEDVEVGQVHYPFIAEDDVEYIERTGAFIKEINSKTNGVQNVGLEDMPEKIEYKPVSTSKEYLYLGKEYEEISEFYIQLEQSLLIQGEFKAGKSNVVKLLVEQLKKEHKITILDDLMNTLNIYENDPEIQYFGRDINVETLDSDIYILNKFDMIEGLGHRERTLLLDKLYLEFLRGKYFIIENNEATRGTEKFYKQIKNPMSIVYIDDIATQSYVRRVERDLKEIPRNKYDIYYIRGTMIDRVKTPLIDDQMLSVDQSVAREDKYASKKEKSETGENSKTSSPKKTKEVRVEYNEIDFNGRKISDKHLTIAGANPERALNILEQEYKRLGKEINYLTLKNIDEIQTETNKIVIANLGEILKSVSILDKTSVSSKIENIIDNNVFIAVIQGYVYMTGGLTAKVIKQGSGIVTETISLQRVLTTRDLGAANRVLEENEIAYITDSGETVEFIKIY